MSCKILGKDVSARISQIGHVGISAALWSAQRFSAAVTLSTVRSITPLAGTARSRHGVKPL